MKKTIKRMFRFIALLLLPGSWLRIRGKNKGSVYLTYDDGPDPAVTPRLIELLKSKNAKATFFLIGKNVEAHPDLTRQIADNGHGIGNHSYRHQFFHKLKMKEQLEEIRKTNQLIEQITGRKCTFFRAPGGRISGKLFIRLIGMGITSIYWNRDSNDWNQECDQVVEFLTKNPIKARDIVLLHDDDEKVLGITEYVLNNYANYRFESV